AADLSERQALDLMFHAGVTTRDEVTSTSGRGVGMDVVRTAIQQVGGSVDVSSTPGHGAVFRLNVPLTLAIMPVLVTWSGGGRYAVPQVHLREVTQIDAVDVAERVDEVEGSRLLRLRGRLLPLVDLAGRLGVEPQRSGGLVVVVVEADGRRFGLLVDDVGDTVDAVVKPLPRLLRGVAAYAGTTILGDGRPALVLDVAALAAAAGIGVATGADDTGAETAPAAEAAGLLLATAPDGGRFAVRVTQVRRLESFPDGRIERAGDLEVVQYGDVLLPLVRVFDVLPERRQVDRSKAPLPALDAIAAVVCDTSTGLVGFVVASIDDVVPEPQVPRQPASRRGVEACVVVGERVAELLDVEVLAADAGVSAR
ncbi:MAG: chemotaxis protein CheW, partial [Mycobacteriales bacterium]